MPQKTQNRVRSQFVENPCFGMSLSNLGVDDSVVQARHFANTIRYDTVD